MKKVIVGLVLVALVVAMVPVTQAEQQGRGGFMGFIAGCCFGVRAAGAYNDGKEIHWREWVMLVPFVSVVFAVWNGVEGMNGVSTKDLATQYGAMYY